MEQGDKLHPFQEYQLHREAIRPDQRARYWVIREMILHLAGKGLEEHGGEVLLGIYESDRLRELGAGLGYPPNEFYPHHLLIQLSQNTYQIGEAIVGKPLFVTVFAKEKNEDMHCLISDDGAVFVDPKNKGDALICIETYFKTKIVEVLEEYVTEINQEIPPEDLLRLKKEALRRTIRTINLGYAHIPDYQVSEFDYTKLDTLREESGKFVDLGGLELALLALLRENPERSDDGTNCKNSCDKIDL